MYVRMFADAQAHVGISLLVRCRQAYEDELISCIPATLGMMCAQVQLSLHLCMHMCTLRCLSRRRDGKMDRSRERDTVMQ
mmetsp:Transcript_3084/g.5602  ORF Transcript_3084/g.5602 Transcript_3084/m.5602 type:complete len:80 (-) Transcript_3084:6-245(-)